jgi:hypothetical protein
VITIFSSPKPFVGHIDTVQRNALASWLALGQDVEVLLVGDEKGVGGAAAEYGVRHLPQVLRNEHGTPLLNSIFDLARRHARHPFLCYVNADVMLLEDLLPAVRQVSERFERFLIVGRRWDLDVPERLGFDPGWQAALRKRIEGAGTLHPPTGSDYFVFPRPMFEGMPPFALGRAGWDNWMIFAGRHGHVPVIDATEAVTVVHQVHDYSHLPGGRPHFRLPESLENVKMGGGRVTVFTIADTTWRFGPQGLLRRTWREAGLKRWLEAGLYARLGGGRSSRLARMALHPIETSRYYYWAARRRAHDLLKGTRSEQPRS